MLLNVKFGMLVILLISIIWSFSSADSDLIQNKKVKRGVHDWFSWLFGDYFDYYDDSEEYLICRNCTVHIEQQIPMVASTISTSTSTSISTLTSTPSSTSKVNRESSVVTMITASTESPVISVMSTLASNTAAVTSVYAQGEVNNTKPSSA